MGDRNMSYDQFQTSQDNHNYLHEAEENIHLRIKQDQNQDQHIMMPMTSPAVDIIDERLPNE